MSRFSEIRSQLPATCRVLAVSKLQSALKIRELHKLGQTDFAENYVQEAVDKLSELSDLQLNWHFIGHLQTNKAKQVAGKFAYIHSVDSVRIAEALSKHMPSGQKQKIFLQVNLAGEASKEGFSEAELTTNFKLIQQLPGVEICGLMTMPPLHQDAEQNRPHFRRLRELRDQFAKECKSLIELSMGTSSDYKVAAEEGATWVRLGTILFGERQP